MQAHRHRHCDNISKNKCPRIDTDKIYSCLQWFMTNNSRLPVWLTCLVPRQRGGWSRSRHANEPRSGRAGAHVDRHHALLFWTLIGQFGSTCFNALQSRDWRRNRKTDQHRTHGPDLSFGSWITPMCTVWVLAVCSNNKIDTNSESTFWASTSKENT